MTPKINLTLATCLLLCACGGGGETPPPPTSAPAPTPTPTPTPPPITYMSATLSKSYQIHTLSSSDVVPEYIYGGQTFPRGIADIFPQGSISADFQKDRFPELIIPLNKAYGTPAFARLPYLYLSNDSGRLEFRQQENAQFPSVFGARRSSFLTVNDAPAAFFVAHNVSGVYNDPTAYGTAVLALGGTSGARVRADLIPRITTQSDVDANGTDAHAMAAGDINGDGKQDILIGNWFAFTPLFLLQTAEGSFTVDRSDFLTQLKSVPLLNPNRVPEGASNLWLDVHLADLNGDGYDEIIAGFGHGSAHSYVFWNDRGSFSFDNKTPLPVTVYGTENNLHMETRTTDLDGDGDLDIVISHSRYSPFYGGDYLQIIRNDGGVFVDITNTALRQENSDIYAGFLQWSPALYVKDVNKDGKDDIIFARQNGTLRIYINENGSSFRNFDVPLPASEGVGVLIGFDDFDNDGNFEAVYWQFGGNADRKDYFVNLYELNFR